jgi:hypothetical protein
MAINVDRLVVVTGARAINVLALSKINASYETPERLSFDQQRTE